MRLLWGQDLEDFKDAQFDLTVAEAKLAQARENAASSKAGWINTAAELEGLQEAFDQANDERRELEKELKRARQRSDMFERAFVTLGAKFIERAPEYAEVES